MTTTTAPDSMEVDTPVHPLQSRYDEAEELAENLPDRAIKEFVAILKYDGEDNDLEEIHRVKEHSIYQLGQLYTKHG